MRDHRSRTTNLIISIAITGIAGLTILMILLLSVTGKVSLGNHGVCMDAEGNIYVGRDRQITVYDLAGTQIQVISPHTSRGYQFRIERDQLYVTAGGRILKMDLTGTILGQENDTVRSVQSVRKEHYTFESRAFEVSRNHFYFSVKEQLPGGERIILEESTWNILANIFLLFSVFALLASIAGIIVTTRRGTADA